MCASNCKSSNLTSIPLPCPHQLIVKGFCLVHGCSRVGGCCHGSSASVEWSQTWILTPACPFVWIHDLLQFFTFIDSQFYRNDQTADYGYGTFNCRWHFIHLFCSLTFSHWTAVAKCADQPLFIACYHQRKACLMKLYTILSFYTHKITSIFKSLKHGKP